MPYKSRTIRIQTPAENTFRRLPMMVQEKYITRAKCMGVDYISLYQAEQEQKLDNLFPPTLSSQQNLDNCKYTAQDVSFQMVEEMAKNKRPLVLMGNDSNGKPIYVQISGRNQDERNDNIVQAYIKSGRIWEFISSVQPPTAESIPQKALHPFTAYAQDWYKRYKGHLKATTDVTQRGWLKQLCDFFGDEAIEEITIDRVQDYINSIQKCTTRSIKQRLTFLGEIFKKAISVDKIIQDNPTKSDLLKPGGKKGQGIKALPRDVIKNLIEKIRTTDELQIKFYLALMLYTGLRREEMLGIRWEDIDFEKGVLHIERSVTYPSSKPIIGTTKNPMSERTLFMPDELVTTLKPHKKATGFLIANELGEPYHETDLEILRDRVRSFAELPKLDARELRHSYATMLHEAGIEVKAIGVTMGHTNTDTTNGYIDNPESSRLQNIRNAGIDYVLG